MNKFLIIALLGLAVIASGCTDSVQEEPEQDQSEIGQNDTSMLNDNSNVTTVTYTDSGFQPSEVTVERGETVVWESQASSVMWVASDQHPSHTNYAGSSLREHCSNGDQTSAAFDQCSTGNSFSFTFEKVGTWNYHNHRAPSQGGTVTVEAP